MHTPFFPQFRPRLAALSKRVQSLRLRCVPDLDELFTPFLPAGLLSQADQGLNSRKRLYPVRLTFFAFLYQVLKPSCACREVVRQIQARAALHGHFPVAASTAAYCQARMRLPLDSLQRLRVGAAASAERGASNWRGFRIKLIDATTVTLPDTAKNQRAYPQSASQQPGCGFPLMKIVGVFSLASGALLDYAKGNKHQHDLSLFLTLLDLFKPKDLLVADRGFCTYVVLALMQRIGVECVFRLHHSRSTDLRQGRMLGRNDRLCLWHKPFEKPVWLPKFLWNQLSDQLTVRILRFDLRRPGFRTKSVTLVTTLLDGQAIPAEQIAALYVRRWQIELRFRDIKTSMGMDQLRCKTPAMVHKELEMFFTAYNLIRCLMAQASALSATPVDRLSFKGTVDALRQFSPVIMQVRSKKRRQQLVRLLLETIAEDEIPYRPNRREPRALKRRPKPYDRLTKPRHLFKEIPHRNNYRAKISPYRRLK